MKDSQRKAMFAQKTLSGKTITLKKGDGKNQHEDFYVISGDGSPQGTVSKSHATEIFLAKINVQNKRTLRLKFK